MRQVESKRDAVRAATAVLLAEQLREARARFGDVLDQAEQGDELFIERNGLRFRVRVERSAPARDAGSPCTAVDATVRNDQWSWTQGRRDAAASLRTRRARR